MEPRTIGYVFDGDTFIGHWNELGAGDTAIVTVWYKHVHVSAAPHGLAPDHVARVLLGELVKDDMAGRLAARRTATGQIAA